jgi:ABC-type sugar transport system ATPase subunit
MEMIVMGNTILTIRNLEFEYPGELKLHVPKFELTSCDFIIVIGPNSAGKTTFCKLLAGLLDERYDEFITRSKKGYPVLVWQEGELFPLSVENNLRIVPNNPARVDELIKQFELAQILNRKPGPLSGGQKQRVAIARALAVRDRPAIILDEPTQSLDPNFVEEIAEIIRDLPRREGVATIVVTHEQRLVSLLSTANPKIYILEPVGPIDQKPRISIIKGSFTISEIFKKPPSRYAAEFVGYENIYWLHNRREVSLRNLLHLEDQLPDDAEIVIIPPEAIEICNNGDNAEPVTFVGSEWRQGGTHLARFRWSDGPIDLLARQLPEGQCRECRFYLRIKDTACIRIPQNMQ